MLVGSQRDGSLVRTPSSVKRRAGRSGQATTEWALLLAVFVVAIFAIGWILGGGFATDMQRAASGAKNVYTTGTLNR